MIDLQGAIVTEHFRCKCGHEWSREMEAAGEALVSVGCPICGRQNKTMLGRFILPLMLRARDRRNH